MRVDVLDISSSFLTGMLSCLGFPTDRNMALQEGTCGETPQTLSATISIAFSPFCTGSIGRKPL